MAAARSIARSSMGMCSGRGIVSCEWLRSELDREAVPADLIILDSTWLMPSDPRDPDTEFVKMRLPGAKRFDVDAVADTTTGLPHMMPSLATFAASTQQGKGLFSAPTEKIRAADVAAWIDSVATHLLCWSAQ